MTMAITQVSRWSLPETRRREAVRAAHEQDPELLEDLLQHHLTLKSARRAQVSDDTRRLYGLALRKFVAHCAGAHGLARLEIARLEPEDVDGWLVALQQDGLSPNTLASYLYGVRALYRALAWAGAASGNPAAEVKPPRDPTPAHARKSALPPKLYRELAALPESRYPADDPRQARDALLLALGGSAGLRAMEICALDAADIDTALGRITVRSGKGGKRRQVPVARALQSALARWAEVRRGLELRGDIPQDETALLVSLSSNSSHGRRLTTSGARYIASGYYRAMGLPPELWGLHTLRRTAGTHLYRATRDLHVVADVLGHASVTTSAIYAKMDMDVRREALEKMESLRDDA